MSGVSNYAELKILEHAMAKTTWTKPTTVYLALFTSDPGDDASGSEVSGGAYARQAITWGTAAAGQIANSAQIEFPVATANWGTITHVGIFDASSAGNLIWHGAVSTSKVINTDDQYIVQVGDLTVSLD
jgi:hypothetical protein